MTVVEKGWEFSQKPSLIDGELIHGHRAVFPSQENSGALDLTNLWRAFRGLCRSRGRWWPVPFLGTRRIMVMSDIGRHEANIFC